MIAVLASALFMAMGLVVIAGQYITEYRQMQSLADLAAMAGAQDLP